MVAVYSPTGPQLVLDELNHRFLNSLQVIATLAAASHSDDGGAAPTKLVRLRTCIGALASVHRLLAVSAAPVLEDAAEEICRDLSTAFNRPLSLDLRIEGEPEDVSLRRGLLLLVVELVTNALKHARSGPLHILISLEPLRQGWRLRVDSDARGASGRPRVAAALAEWLGGSLTVQTSAGFAVCVTMPSRAPASFASD